MDLEVWNRSKGKYCKQNKIDLHIDDSDVYCNHFESPYAIYKHSK